jgi:hypothetical protein
MRHPARREDFSRFLIHLTRNYEGTPARDNLVAMLRERVIEARNPHCLFQHEITNMGFSPLLSKAFTTVCFTETPLTQIHRLTGTIPGRRIELRPYGLVFNKDDLIRRGASPAIYLNAKGTKLRNYLLNRFRDDFNGIRKLKTLRALQMDDYGSIIQYYALVNIIAENYDFTWEREWRHSGRLKFQYRDLVAIVASDPDTFATRCKIQLPQRVRKYMDMIPIISPSWSYEDMLEAMSIKIWDNACKPTQ